MTLTLEKLGHDYYGMSGLGCAAGQVDDGAGGCIDDLNAALSQIDTAFVQTLGPSAGPNGLPLGSAAMAAATAPTEYYDASGNLIVPGGANGTYQVFSPSGSTQTVTGTPPAVYAVATSSGKAPMSQTTMLVIGGAAIMFLALMISKR